MVKSTTTSKNGLASTAESDNNHISEQDNVSVNSAFTSAAIGMSWQLAVVVLVPIVGGYKLDQSVGTLPLLTLVGVVLAIAGSIFVIRRALKAFTSFTPYSEKARKQMSSYDTEDEA